MNGNNKRGRIFNICRNLGTSLDNLKRKNEPAVDDRHRLLALQRHTSDVVGKLCVLVSRTQVARVEQYTQTLVHRSPHTQSSHTRDLSTGSAEQRILCTEWPHQVHSKIRGLSRTQICIFRAPKLSSKAIF